MSNAQTQAKPGGNKPQTKQDPNNPAGNKNNQSSSGSSSQGGRK